MKLVHIEGTARGLTIAWDLTSPVQVLVGPTGAGKTTAVSLGLWALEGRLRTHSEPVSAPAKVFAALSAGGDPVYALVALEDGDRRRLVVTRRLSAGPSGVVQEITCNACPPGAGARAVQARIDELVGPISVTDVGALLALGATDQRRVLLEACASAAEPWSLERVEAELRQSIGDILTGWSGDAPPPAPRDVLALAGTVSPCAGEDWHQSLARQAATIHRAALDAATDLRAQRVQVEGFEAVVGRGEGDPARLRREMSEVQVEGERLAREIGQAEQVETERERLILAMGEMPAAVGERPAPWTPDPKIDLARRAVDAAQTERASAKAAHTNAVAAAQRMQRTVGALVDGVESHCPTCLQAIALDALDVLRHELAAVQAKAGAAEREVQECDLDLTMAQAHLQRALDLDARRRQTIDTEIRAWEEAARRGQARAETAKRLNALPARVDVAPLRARLEQLRARRSDLAGHLQQASAADERDRQAELAQERLATAEARVAGLQVADRAWQRVVQVFGAEAIGPFVRVVGDLLPAGWRVSADLERMAIWVERPGRPRALVERLSRGETVLWHAAAGAALAKMSGARLRLVVADHAEALSEDDHVLVRGVRALASAAVAGVLDQVLVCTGRLSEPETQALAEDSAVAVLPVGDVVTPAERQPDPVAAALEPLDAYQIRDLAARLLPMWAWPEAGADAAAVAEQLVGAGVPVEHVTACAEQVGGRRRRQKRSAA